MSQIWLAVMKQLWPWLWPHIVPHRVLKSCHYFRQGFKIWASTSLAAKEGSVSNMTLLCLGWQGCQKANNLYHTPLSKWGQPQTEAEVSMSRRWWILTDGINVSSMSWFRVLSVGQWDKTAPVTQKPEHCWLLVMVMPEWCSRVLWSQQEHVNTITRINILFGVFGSNTPRERQHLISCQLYYISYFYFDFQSFLKQTS